MTGVGALAVPMIALRRLEDEARAALGLLTRLPVGQRSAIGGGGAFGLVGALVASVGALALLLVGERVPLGAAGLAIGLIALVSGGLHLDGLADTFDALAAPDAEAAERARKDPRIGTAGATAIVTVMLVDAAVLASLVSDVGPWAAALACIVAGGASRAGAVVAVVLVRDAIREGSGAWLASMTGAGSAITASGTVGVLAVVLAATAHVPALAGGVLGGAILASLASAWLVRRRGGLDGDLLGATVELTFASTLLVTLALA